MEIKYTLLTDLNLRLFDGGAAAGGEGGGGDAGAGTPTGTQTAQEIPAQEPSTSVTTKQKDERKAAFESLIKGEYKELYDERVQSTINARFKQMKGLEERVAQLDELQPMLEMLASKYGVDAKNVDKLVSAIQEDDSYYQDEAMQKGLTVEQLKNIKKMERENAEFKRAAAERERQENAARVYANWQQQADACKQMYANFDLRSEIESPETGKRFTDLLKSGVDVKTAFEVIHKDEIIGSAMQYTAQQVQQKVTNDIRARGLRPEENGGSNSAAVITKSDPSKWTKKDRDAIAKRVLRGERIEL